MSDNTIRGISSMATRLLLADLAEAYRARSGVEVRFESVGGVDATRRVLDGEAFDVAVLAADAIDKLAAAGRVDPASRRDLVLSKVVAAVRAGDPQPDIGSEDALRRAVLAASSIGYSTGPSGTALLELFARWGLLETLRPRLVQAQPGIPVGKLLADGRVALGFQQTSELMHLDGVAILGELPPACAIVSCFSAAVCTASPQPEAARALLDDLAAPAAAALKLRHGMQPA